MCTAASARQQTQSLVAGIRARLIGHSLIMRRMCDCNETELQENEKLKFARDHYEWSMDDGLADRCVKGLTNYLQLSLPWYGKPRIPGSPGPLFTLQQLASTTEDIENFTNTSSTYAFIRLYY